MTNKTLPTLTTAASINDGDVFLVRVSGQTEDQKSDVKNIIAYVSAGLNIGSFITSAAAASEFVPQTTTVNGQALSGNVTITNIAGNAGTVTNGVYTTDTGTVTGTMIASGVALAGSPTTTTQAAADASTKIATTAYVDSAVFTLSSGLASKGDAACVSTTNIAGTYLSGVFTFTATGVSTIDGVQLTANMIIALVGQTATGGSGTVNGLYRVTTAGSVGVATIIQRATNYNTTAEVQAGTYFIVTGGTANSGTFWLNNTTGVVTLDSTVLTFVDVPIGSLSASALTGTTLASNVTASSLTSFGASIALGTPASGVATNLTGTAASLTAGNATTAAACSGNAATATKLAATKTINGTAFDGSGNITVLSYAGVNVQTGTTYAPQASDCGLKLATTGMGANTTWTFTAASSLGANWETRIFNDSLFLITLASSGGTIDGLSGYIMYPGEVRDFYCDNSKFTSVIVKPFSVVFTSSTTWMRPPGYTWFDNELICGGASGSARATTGNTAGGAGGAWVQFLMPASAYVAIGSTETVTIGAAVSGVSGNTNGNSGNTTSITVNGVTISSLAGAAPTQAALGSSTAGGVTGSAFFSGYAFSPTQEGTTGAACNASNVPATSSTPNGARCAGAGGAVSSTSGGVTTGGTSLGAGAGGNAGTFNGSTNGSDGTAPGGGGGGAVQGKTSGGGAKGQLVIRGVN